MCTAILRGMKIIATIPKAAPVVTVARTIIIAAWGISRSIAMVMAAAIRMSMQQSIMMNAAVAMSIMLRAQLGTLRMRMMTVAVDTSIIITGMRSMSTTTVAAGTSIITTSMKSMSTMSVAVVTSIIMSIMCPVTLRTVSVSFAILTKSIVMFVVKA